MRIGVDVMGGDIGPEVLLPGALSFLKKHTDTEIVLYGVRGQIERILTERGIKSGRYSIVDCRDTIEPDFKPEGTSWLKERAESSLLRMYSDLKNAEIDGGLSAGNTAAFVAGGLLKIGRSGKSRLALASEFPSPQYPLSLALDMGANTDVSPQHLVDYALMAHAYEGARHARSLEIATLNIGTEDGKGMHLQQEANRLLRELSDKAIIEYIGNVEPEALLGGERKAIIADAFSLNIALKSMKAASNYTLDKIPLLGAILKRFATGKSAGALLLGLKKPMVKANGNSTARIIANSLEELHSFILAEKNYEVIAQSAERYQELKAKIQK